MLVEERPIRIFDGQIQTPVIADILGRADFSRGIDNTELEIIGIAGGDAGHVVEAIGQCFIQEQTACPLIPTAGMRILPPRAAAHAEIHLIPFLGI